MRVLDRFRSMKKLSAAIGKVPRADARRPKAECKEPAHRKSRWLPLKWRDSLSGKQIPRLEGRSSSSTSAPSAPARSRRSSASSWTATPTRARKFLKRRRRRAIRSKIKPLAKFSATLWNYRPLILNWFRTGRCHSSGAVEGMNLKARLALGRACGFRSCNACELALYHTLGNLPQPDVDHRFC